jgi:hypothetical protein
MFAYIAACNIAAVGGYSDWRPANDLELANIRDMEVSTAAPDAAAFPSWPTDDYIFSGTTYPSLVSYALIVNFSTGIIYPNPKVTAFYVALLRGG